MIPGKPFDPATETSRRPTPEKFAHLREWVAPVKRDIRITSITEMTNINQQLEQNAELYVSNIISRVIAQLIGKYGDGFVTLEATKDGELKVFTDDKSQTVLNVIINTSGAGAHSIVTPPSGKKIKITNIMFTVSGDVDITFYSNTTAISGTMLFGGTDEPRGMVHHFGDFPLETGSGEVFYILTSTAAEVKGYMTYFTE